MNLHDCKSKIIGEFEKADIRTSTFPHNPLSLQPEPGPPTESIGENVKLKR